MTRIIIEARCDDHDEIARDAEECEAAGASIIHYPRGDAETTELVRKVSELLVMGAGEPSQHARPDLGLVELESFDEAAAGRYDELGVKPVARLWSVGSARMLSSLIERGVVRAPAYAHVTLSDPLLSAHPLTVDGFDAMHRFLPDDGSVLWAVVGLGADVRTVAAEAIDRRGHVAIGRGDYAYPELGRPSNADLVHALADLVRRAGLRVATPAETRSMLEV